MRGALLALALSSAALADEPSRSLSVFALCGRGFHQEGQGFARACSLAVQAGRPLSRRLTLLLEAQPLVLVRQPREPAAAGRETAIAAALDVGLRVRLGPLRWRARPYLEVLEGPLYAARRVPATGTRFNFLTQAGAGVELSGDGFRPTVSLRWVHISNAGLGDRNPDWDFQSIALGVARSFR